MLLASISQKLHSPAFFINLLIEMEVSQRWESNILGEEGGQKETVFYSHTLSFIIKVKDELIEIII